MQQYLKYLQYHLHNLYLHLMMELQMMGRVVPGKYEESLRTFEKLHKEMHKERLMKMKADENAIIGDENNEERKTVSNMRSDQKEDDAAVYNRNQT